MASKASIARREAEAAEKAGGALAALAEALGVELEAVPARYYPDRDYRRMVAAEVHADNLVRLTEALEARISRAVEPDAKPAPKKSKQG